MPDTRHTATTELQTLNGLRDALATNGPTQRIRDAAAHLAEPFARALAAPYNVQARLLQPATDALKNILVMEGNPDDDDN